MKRKGKVTMDSRNILCLCEECPIPGDFKVEGMDICLKIDDGRKKVRCSYFDAGVQPDVIVCRYGEKEKKEKYATEKKPTEKKTKRKRGKKNANIP